MKLYKSIFAVLAVAAVSGAFVSCDDDLDRPPVIVPEASYKANTSIAEFKQLFWDVAQSNSTTTIPVNANGDSIIIGGRVVSSDRYGNVYQHLYVEDESGAMDFRIYSSNIYESYSPGQEVRVNVTGLLVGGYGTQMQVGTTYNGGIGGMDMDVFKIRAQRNGLPNAKDAEPETVTLQDLTSWINDKDKQIYWQCRLVKIENVTFGADGGVKGWCEKPGEKNTTTRKLTDAEGLSIDVRTSDMCKFNKQILPKGTGTVIAILGYYKNNSGNPSWQLTIMDPQSGCIDGFEFVDVPETPDTPGTGDIVTSLDETFTGATIPSNWTLKKVSGDKDWFAREFNGSSYASCTGFNGKTPPFDTWLVSPGVDLSKAADKKLSFETQVNGYGSTTSSLEVYVMDAVDPSKATTKTKLDPALATAPESGYSAWTSSGDLDLSAFDGVVYIGFRYYATQDANYATWCVANVKLNAAATPPPATEGYFSESFASGQGDFTIDVVSMSPDLTYVWTHDASNKYMKASAYVQGSKASDAYLISPVIDLTGATAPVLTFDQIINKFPSVDVAKEQISVCAREEGASAWTKLDMTEYGTNSGWTWIESGNISLAAYAGKKMQIAFHYTSTDEASGTWEVKNVSIK